MKLSIALLQAIALGVSVSAATTSCKRDDVKSGSINKEKKGESSNPNALPSAHDKCPACGMG